MGSFVLIHTSTVGTVDSVETFLKARLSRVVEDRFIRGVLSF